MNQVDLSKVPEYLQSRRWFGGKAWPIKQVSIVDHVQFELNNAQWRSAEAAVLAVVEVTYELGTPERYLLPIIPLADGGFRDALDNDDVSRALFRLIQEGSSIPAGTGALKGERTAGSEEILKEISETPSLRRIGAEQSNTSIVYGDRAMLKIIRKVEAGVHPEYEMSRFFAEHGPFKRVPQMLGSLQLDGPSPMTLAVVHEFIPSEGDGWGHTVEAFRNVAERGETLVKDVALLGQRIGEMHQVLASEPNDPAFVPEPLGRDDLQRWSSSIIGEMSVALSLAGEAVPELAERRGVLTRRAQRLAHAEPSGQKIRVHGDLHLGQTLFASNDWMIFDFEGEPLRPFNQRREKHSALKDVAGMLRSFSYAAATADPEGRLTREWLPRVRAAFMKGYKTATKGAAFLPQGETLDLVLETLELEKLLYELRYEVQHRPAWVKIPAQALMEMEDVS